MTELELRRRVKSEFPSVKISIKTTSFVDLGRTSRKALNFIESQTNEQQDIINGWAKEAGIIPDTSIYMRHMRNGS